MPPSVDLLGAAAIDATCSIQATFLPSVIGIAIRACALVCIVFRSQAAHSGSLLGTNDVQTPTAAVLQAIHLPHT